MLWGRTRCTLLEDGWLETGNLKSCFAKQSVFANENLLPWAHLGNAGLASHGPVGLLLARAELSNLGTVRYPAAA